MPKKSTFIKLAYSLFLIILLTSNLHAKIVLIPAFDGIIIPIVAPEEEPDIVAPSKPIFSITPPTTTSEDSVHVEIRGEVGARIFVNGRIAGTIGNSGKIIVSLNTSGADGRKNFSIILKDNSNNSSGALVFSITKVPDPKFELEYKGLIFYHQNIASSNYTLNQLSNSEFNALNDTQKLLVANKLLSTLFFGYPQNKLQEKIDSDNFISGIRHGLEEDITDKAWLESYILDDDIFEQYSRWSEPQAINILSRFYAMKHLDKYFLNNWIAYILTQTIMFSPAYELDSAHTPNIANVYNRIVTYMNDEAGMKYITYIHMMSEDNWRRFRSPEDNGREMLEIYQFDMNDAHVPIAGQALQNWKLNTDSDTLEIGLNENTQGLNLFGTIIVNGDDFYRELVKSNLFTKGVTRRLVDFFFPKATENKKQQLVNTIIASHPETWQDILLQIVFSKEYLLHTQRAKSAEETFFSLAKKMNYRHRRNTFYYLKEALESMHQASMKYKLGKLNRVPLDTLSFAYYHKYIREEVLLRRSNPDSIASYSSWSRQGWDVSYTSFDNFNFNENNIVSSLDSFINYLFKSIIYRQANPQELQFFRAHMIYEEDGEKYFHWAFNMFTTHNDPERQDEEREERKRYIAYIVLDYISRLDSTYIQREVQ